MILHDERASVVRDTVPTSHYYSALFGGPVRVAPYAPFGTQRLADNVLAALEDRLGALMRNHGAVTIGPSLDKALSLLPYLENICDSHLRAMASGAPVALLSQAQVTDAVEALKGYGQGH